MGRRAQEILSVRSTRQKLSSVRVADAAFDQALDALVDSWTDGFLDLVHEAKLSEEDVEAALEQGGLTADTVNDSADKPLGI